MSARGSGARKKTALHVAAEFGHAAVVEYIVNMTQGVLNLETDAIGNKPNNGFNIITLLKCGFF